MTISGDRLSAEREIVQLEHESGLRPVGDDPGHCGACARVHATRQRQAVCSHGSVDEVRTLGGDVFRTCIDCGASLDR